MKSHKKEHYDYLYKSNAFPLPLQVILVGDPSVGKTSYLLRLTKNIISKTPQPTIGIEYATQSMLLKNGEGIVKAQIWDTAGAEKYKAITTAHYRKSVGALLFYDLTERQSYDNILVWLEDKAMFFNFIKQIENNTDEDTVIMVIGNKSDLLEEVPRCVEEEEVRNLCSQRKILYNETSAKNGLNVKTSFEELIESIFPGLQPLE